MEKEGKHDKGDDATWRMKKKDHLHFTTKTHPKGRKEGSIDDLAQQLWSYVEERKEGEEL